MEQDLKEHMDTYAKHAASIADMCDSEEQTKVSLINPYIELLGYDVRNPRHVRVEFRADFHTGREKVDYVILRDGNPWAVIEAKSATQILGTDNPTKQVQRYAMAVDVQFVAYTNGRIWRWFRKNPVSSMLEEKPFLEHDVTKPEDREVRWLAVIHNSHWNGEEIKRIADEERLQSDFTNWFRDCQSNPSDRFLKLLLNDSGQRATGSMLEQARVAWKQVVRAAEAAQLNEASRRLRGEANDNSGQYMPEPDAAQGASADSSASRKRWKFRWRYGSAGPWNYEQTGKAAQIAVATHYFSTAVGSSNIHHLLKRLNTKYGRDRLREETALLLEPGATAPERFQPIGTSPDIIIYINLTAAQQAIWFTRLMNAAPHFRIETDQGQRDGDMDREQWPWTSVASVVTPSK